MNKNFLLLVIALILGVSAIVFLRSEKSEMVDTVKESSEELNSSESATADLSETISGKTPVISSASSSATEKVTVYPRLQERLNVMHERRPEQKFDPTEVHQAMQRKNAWAARADVPTDLPLEEKALHDGRQFIHFDSLKLETLVPGEEVLVPIAETQREYAVKIESVVDNGFGALTWNGHIDTGDGTPYSVSFTRGPELTVGGIETPEGHYVVQAHGQTGWIASASLLFKVPNPDVSDAIIPPAEVPPEETHHHEHND
jgi:hypothetical protein